MTNETAYHGAIFLLDPDLVVAAVRSGMGEFDTMVGAVLDQRLVDQRASLSESIPRMGKGNLCSMASSPAVTRDCSLARMGTASVQPVQTLVAIRLWMNDPDRGPPQCATRAISKKPGGGPFQSL